MKPIRTTTMPSDGTTITVALVMATDPAEFADRLRRPVPFRPDRFARRGTRFHAWLEHRYGATHLLVDGFFSRPSLARIALGRIAPDDARITEARFRFRQRVTLVLGVLFLPETFRRKIED